MRIKAGKGTEGAWISVRAFFIRFDYLRYVNGVRLIQFGDKPVKFIVYIPKSAKMPKFLMATAWKPVYQNNIIRLGITKKPLNLSKLWRIHDEQRVHTRSKFERLDMQHWRRDHGITWSAGHSTGDGGLRDHSVPEVRDTCTSE